MPDREDICVIIPARGGSKGIPRKNLQTVGGIPLIARSIMAAKAAGTVGQVFVSTDDEEIARTASQYGAAVVRRPAEIAGDITSSEAALLHALDALEEQGYRPAVVVFLQCTSPFTRGSDIDLAVSQFLGNGDDVCFSANVTHSFVWKLDREGHPCGVNHDGKSRLMRQQREREFMETGAIYVLKAAGLRAAKFRFFGKMSIFEADPARAMEIDTVSDLLLARALACELDVAAVPQRGMALPFSSVRSLVMDFDGVFTDDRVLVSETGIEAVLCSRSDGFGLEQLKLSGMKLAVISRETNKVVGERCKKLGVEVLQGARDKLPVLEKWCADNSIAPGDIAYIGNDITDIEVMHVAGIAFAPADAHPRAKQAAHIVLEKNGGNGALRELAEMFGIGEGAKGPTFK